MSDVYFTRRNVLHLMATLPALAQAASTPAQEGCAVFTPDRQARLSPDAAVSRLMQGNERFVAGKTMNCDLLQQVQSTAGGQAPFAAVVGCIDSRVPPELVFDQRLGDIFCVRIAGNFINNDILGSLEFATQVAGAKAIIVLGHTECGAIKGAIDKVQLGHLTAMLENIRPAVDKVTATHSGPHTAKDKKLVQKVADQHVRDAAHKLLAKSDVLRTLANEGRLKVAAAMHHLNTGKISWI